MIRRFSGASVLDRSERSDNEIPEARTRMSRTRVRTVRVRNLRDFTERLPTAAVLREEARSSQRDRASDSHVGHVDWRLNTRLNPYLLDIAVGT